MLNEVVIAACHDGVKVFVLNHGVMLESLPFSTVRYDGLATNPITFIFLFRWCNDWTLVVFTQTDE